MWSKRLTDEGGNSKWVLANTKPCPKCKKAIEKNEGAFPGRQGAADLCLCV